MPTLQGVAVLVTRPAQQAGPLCDRLTSEGASVVRLPTIDIKPVGDRAELSARVNPIGAFDSIVFTSANAAHHGAWLLSGEPLPPLVAIGPATARALAGFTGHVAVSPLAAVDSETLLRHPALTAAAGRRILIVKGKSGRQLLEQRLAERGAQVTVLEVYQRERVKYSRQHVAALEASFSAGAVHVITATSVEIALALLELATPSLRREFERVQWLVPSARVAAVLREHGIAAPMLLAASADDHALVSTLERWRASVSEA